MPTPPDAPAQTAPAGWYQDQNVPGQLRWWDGSTWTEHVQAAQSSGVGSPPPQGPPQAGRPWAGTAGQVPPSKPKKPWYRRTWVIVTGGILAIVIIASLAGGSGEQSDSGDDQAGVVESDNSKPGEAQGDQGDQSSDPEKPNEATGDNAPHVGSKGKVTVDGLVWSISSAKAVSTIGDQSIGTDATADGIFVVVTAKVHSTKGETVTLTDDVVKLEGGSEGSTYSADTEGTTSALLSSGNGAEPFFLEDIQPDTTTTGTLVYDVPKAVLRGDPELRFNELGFGETHAYIALPGL